MGRNKPPGEISQGVPGPAASYTHCLCKSGKHHLFLRSKHPGHPLHQYSRAQPSARRPPRGPWGFRHHGTSRRQSPTSAHARCRAGNGEEWGRTLGVRNPATLLLKSPQQAARRPPASVRGPWPRHRLENPTAKALLARPGAKPSARRPPAARGGSVIMGHRGASRPPARTHAIGPERGRAGADPTRSQPRHAPAQGPPPATSRPPRLSQGPMLCYSHRPLTTGCGPYRAT